MRLAGVELEAYLEAALGGLLAFARALVGERSGAEDVVQEVVTRLLADPTRFAQIHNPDAYLRRMVVNEYLSWGRKWFRVRVGGTVGDREGSAVDDPAEVVAERDDLRDRLAQLPRNQRGRGDAPLPRSGRCGDR